MFNLRKTDEQRIAALESKIEAAREACAASSEVLASASLDAAEGGNPAALERAERDHTSNAVRVGQLELARKRLRADVEAKRVATAAAEQQRHAAQAKASRDALRAAVAAFQDKVAALGEAAENVAAAIADYYRFADSEDKNILTDLRLAVPRILAWFVRNVTGVKPALVATDSTSADLMRYAPRSRA